MQNEKSSQKYVLKHIFYNYPNLHYRQTSELLMLRAITKDKQSRQKKYSSIIICIYKYFLLICIRIHKRLSYDESETHIGNTVYCIH